MGGRLFVIAWIACFWVAAAAWADPFSEVPAGNWSYRACGRLVALKVLPADRATGFSGSPALTRFEFATAALQPLGEVAQAIAALPKRAEATTVREAALDALNINPQRSEMEIARAANDLARLGAEYEVELRALGFDPTEAVRALHQVSNPAQAREWRKSALARPLLLQPRVVVGAGDGVHVPLGHGEVALGFDRTAKAPPILDALAMSLPAGLTPSARGPAGAALSDPTISRLHTAYEYVLGSGLSVSVGREEIARRGKDLLPLDAATLISLGVGYPVTPSVSVKVSYSLLDYQNYVSKTPPLRERVAETAVSIGF